ncbi:MAG: hypothetical protein AB7U83_21830 [Vicinamibacterales bacterium]
MPTTRVLAARLIVLGLLVMVVSPAAAQRLLFTYAPAADANVSVTQSIDLGAGVVEWTEFDRMIVTPVFTADGEYAVFRRSFTGPATPPLVVRHVRSGAELLVATDFVPWIAHPTDAAVFGLVAIQSDGMRTTGSVARLDGGGLHVGGGCPPRNTMSLDLSADGTALVTLCQSGEVHVLDAATGQSVRTLPPDPTNTVRSVRFARGTSQLLVVRTDAAAMAHVALVDASTGGTDASTMPAVPAGAFCRLAAMTPDRSTALVTCTHATTIPFSIIGWATIIDVGSLGFGPALPVNLPGEAVFSADGREVFMTSRHRLGFGQLTRYDATSGSILQSSGTLFPGFFGVAFPPLAPTLTAAVTGSAVDLSWTVPSHSPLATTFTLEVGSAPGLTDLATFALGPTPAVSVPGAPAGRYYVRVRGVNATGTGAASAELVVDVP